MTEEPTKREFLATIIAHGIVGNSSGFLRDEYQVADQAVRMTNRIISLSATYEQRNKKSDRGEPE